MRSVLQSFQCLQITRNLVTSSALSKMRDVELPPIDGPYSGKFRRIVHYPDKYTVKPLEVTNLGGRDPVSGRVVVKGIGGGIKHKYHWVDWRRIGPKEGEPLVEKVIEIIDDGCRTSKVALVASGNSMKYYLATENMKAGDLIRTSQHIPRNPVLAKEGDAYPLGALPIGTIVCNVEKYAGVGGMLCHSAGSSAVITQKTGNRVIIRMSSKREFSLAQECMATVGRVSNIEHIDTPVGSAQRNRELGNRPRSGLWKRKTGQHGRKIKPTPPVRAFNNNPDLENTEVLKLTFNTDMTYMNKLHKV